MTKILFVAQTETMKKYAQQVCNELGLSIPIIMGTPSQAQEICQAYPETRIFICRGLFVDIFQKMPGKTVAPIIPTVDEFLEVIHKISAQGVKKIAITAFPDILGEKSFDFKIGDTEILFRPCIKENLPDLFRNLERNGVTGLAGGLSSHKMAKERGFITELTDSTTSSIGRAIVEGNRILKIQEGQWQKEEERADQIHTLSTDLYNAIEQSAAAVEEITASAQELASTSIESSALAQKAFQDVSNAMKILEIIKGISKQTNLLGLNAAIEAARSGEHGRGFSIVAKEIRQLSDESNKSAQNINEMLEKIMISVENVLKNVEYNNGIIQEQSRANQNIAEMIDGLVTVGQTLRQLAEKNS